MTWSFETDPDFQQELDWIEAFVEQKVAPLDFLLANPFDVKNRENIRLVRPLQDEVRKRGLWACHLGPELGGAGYGQVKLALMNELIGAAKFGPIVFGNQAPDSGNAEILARFGTPDQKARYLQPLLDGEIVSCFSMTEPQGGADPLLIDTTAVRDGDHWVINGEKWFSTNASTADFFIVMAKSEFDAKPHESISTLIVPGGTPGLEVLRDVGYGNSHPTHGYVRYTDVRVPLDHMLGAPGQGFVVAQTRLGGGRIHHAMRTIAKARKALEYMKRRAVSRTTKGSLLSQKQLVQEKIAQSWVQLEQFRLLVLQTAWKIDKHGDYFKVRKDIAAVKFTMPQVMHDIAGRALHLHGSLGLSTEMPFAQWVIESYYLGLADGPTEVHEITVARELLKGIEPDPTPFPDYHLPRRAEAARALYGAGE
ncbi:acyl-CoA dehydrogenase family protein [Sphingomonas immobilis]|uniref:Acyl-CoA dehydrogenase family protein n=1 Tax=Sphingomonas immobilis TaxID=3063997 RepID=A0ABT9A002_9SPHN|nr:acyl-CoA dehydrogenase family protein [Sphingomonas sp. CA1-15]MDO7843165.1 acyl-CoA dehydrogenase family protein [Sphingomonas sp. CA1-15]